MPSNAWPFLKINLKLKILQKIASKYKQISTYYGVIILICFYFDSNLHDFPNFKLNFILVHNIILYRNRRSDEHSIANWDANYQKDT